VIRRTFRIGLRLGVLFAIGFAIVKVMQSRRLSEQTAGVPQPDPPHRSVRLGLQHPPQLGE
jgi:hypothetical protein